MMHASLSCRPRCAASLAAVLAGTILLGTSEIASAGEGWETHPYGVPANLLPWNHPEYQGYGETAKPAAPPPIVQSAPKRYTITVQRLPQKPQDVHPHIAVLMAHLPEHAQVWFNGLATKSTGKIRYFESPQLTPGKHYFYSVRIVWHENGKWVHKTEKVPVAAGEMHCLYLSPADEKATIAANLSKLSPADRKLAEAQKVCPIHPDDPLGSMGVPVKIRVKGQPVFLCCKECMEMAQADPDKTLAKVKELKAKASGSRR
ncbi:MAG TPA: TIGR03000 domain-containing protein [Gemmataceae bacterium]|nr:TIGR03000 domain-containing protein [Gemmataceae bacterium]